MITRNLVVIGASAGGLPALRQVAAGLPPDLPAAVLIVLHIGTHASALPAMLSNAGPNPAQYAREGERPQPGHLYVAPPDRHLLLEDGLLHLSHGPKENHTRPAIDPLFRSVALNAGPRVIGVVLTGCLDDGAAGLQAVQACGGLTVVQDPDDADEPSMPRAALAAVQADHCVAVAAIGPLLARLVRQAVPAAATPQPARWVQEHQAFKMEHNAMGELDQIGHRSVLVCPECSGTLWEMNGARPPRFRCHVGHAYSLATLQDAHTQATEDAVWTAIRALQDKERLLHQVADADRSAGDEHHAVSMETQAATLGQQVVLLRALLQDG